MALAEVVAPILKTSIIFLVFTVGLSTVPRDLTYFVRPSRSRLR